MTLSLIFAIIALVLSIIYGWMARASAPAILIAVAVALLAMIHILGGGGLLVR